MNMKYDCVKYDCVKYDCATYTFVVFYVRNYIKQQLPQSCLFFYKQLIEKPVIKKPETLTLEAPSINISPST